MGGKRGHQKEFGGSGEDSGVYYECSGKSLRDFEQIMQVFQCVGLVAKWGKTVLEVEL